MPPSERRKFQSRMAKRAFRHGKNWRQTFVDCGGMCLNCRAVDTLEFHEPFGEDKFGWGKFQSRILLCNNCHTEEHYGEIGGDSNTNVGKPSTLSEDVSIEIIMEGRYNNWIKNHGLIDRFAWLQCQKGD